MSEILVLHRGRFQEVASADAEQVSANTWSIHIDADDPVHKRTRRKPTAEAWDGAVFLVDGEETQPAIGTGEDRDGVTVTAFVL